MAYNRQGTAAVFSSVKLYHAVISEGTGIKANYIPCYRKSDSVIGLYDVVGNSFYPNNGSGSFTKGNNVSDIDVATPFNKSDTLTVATNGTAVYANYSMTLKSYNMDYGQNYQSGISYVYYLRATPTCTVA